MVFVRDNLIEPRHGIPTWTPQEVDSSDIVTGKYFGIPPSLLLTPANVDFTTQDFNIPNHGFAQNDVVFFSPTSGSTLPGGVVEGTHYLVTTVVTNSFQISPITGGPPVTLTSNGTGTFYLEFEKMYLNMFYWKTVTTETYMAVLQTNNSTLTFVEIEPQDYANPVDFPKYRTIMDGGSPFTVTDPNLTNSPYTIPRFIQTNNGLYISTARGWQVARSSNFPNTVMSSADIPQIAVLSATFIDSTDTGTMPSTSYNWFQTSQAVDIVATVVRNIGNNIEVEGNPSLPYTVRNQLGLPRALTVQFKTNPGETVRVYRTLQYALPSVSVGPDGTPIEVVGDIAPVDYVQATGDSTSDGSGISTVDLLFNDDVLQTGLPLLYTSISSQGAENANTNAPICADATQFKGHTIYGDVLTQPVGKLELLSIGATTNPLTDALDGHTITVGSTTFTFEYRDYKASYTPGVSHIPVEINPPTDLGDTSLAQYGKGHGYFNSELGYIAPGAGVIPATSIAALIRPFDSSVTSTTGAVGDALADGVSTAAGMTIAGTDITVTIQPDKFDFNKFNVIDATAAPIPGFVFIADSLNATLATVIRYTSVTAPTSGTVVFHGFANTLGDTLTAGTVTGPLNLWFLPGTNMQTLPLYLGQGQIQASGDPGGDPTRPAYLSLVPSRNRPALILAEVTASDSSPVGSVTIGGVTTRHLKLDPTYVGATNQSLSQLIDGTVKNLVTWINANTTTSTEFFARSTEANTATIQSLGYTPIEVSTSATVGDKFEPPLSTTPFDITTLSDARVKSGIMVSKLYEPEAVPIQYALAPQPVGDPSKRIIRLASTRDDAFAFKEREGIYRISLTPGIPVATLHEIVQLDTTVFPIASEAVQVLDDHVYFLADRGFCRIINGSVQYLSASIYQDVLGSIARTPDLNKVRSYVDRAKRIYVCTFPQTNADGSGTTYAFCSKTDKWSTYTNEFDWGVQDATGRITVLNTTFDLENQPVTTAQINSSNISTGQIKNWQYLRQEQYTGRLQENVYDNNFNQVVDSFGDLVFILRQTLNVPDSSFDQFDEMLSSFSLITYNSTLKQATVSRDLVSAYPNPFPDRDFLDFAQRLKDKQLYFKSTINNLGIVTVPVTVVNVVSSNTTTTIVLQLPASVATFAPNPSVDTIEVGVNTLIEFMPFNSVVPFYPGEPEKLKQFSEYTAIYQDRTEPQSLPTDLQMAFAVDNQASFTPPTVFNTTIPGRVEFRTLIPLITARGAFLKVQLVHHRPEQYFQLNGHSFSYKGTDSTRVSLK